MNFIQFAEAHGLIIDHLTEGRWARVKTTDKRRRRNGAYKFLGNVGFVQNHATMERVAVWRPDGIAGEQIDRARLREIERLARAQQESRWLDARNIAEDMLKRATWGAKHPYLVRKGFPHEPGWVLDGELLVPMRDFRDTMKLNSIQRIAEDGQKLFLAGGKAKGSVLKLGNERAEERWLVEGYATALSLREALRDLRRSYQVVVCFSAGNLVHVATMVKRPAYVAADHDRSGTGQKAAAETGLPWVMPPDADTDMNDVHQGKGLRALVKLIRLIDHQTLVREMRGMRP